MWRAFLFLVLLIPCAFSSEVTTERLSVGANGEQGNAAAWQVTPSEDGSLAAMIDYSSNFAPNVPSNTHLNTDAFLRNRTSGTTVGLSFHYDSSVTTHGTLNFTRDGSLLFYNSGDMNNSVWFYRMSDGTNTQVPTATTTESMSSISATGRLLVTRDYASSDPQVFTIIDRSTGTRTPVSVPAGERPLNASAISEDGQIFAFVTILTSIITPSTSDGRLYVLDRGAHTTTPISSTAPSLAMSDDGRWLAYTDTHTAPSQIMLRDRSSGSTRLISATSTGIGGNGDSQTPAISADGRFIAFASSASDLVAGDVNAHVDIFRFDREASTLRLMSVSSSGAASNGDSNLPSLNADGSTVVYLSSGTNLVTGDTNNQVDAFASSSPITSSTTGTGSTTTTGSTTATSSTTGGSTTSGSSAGGTSVTGTTTTSTGGSNGSGGCGLGGFGAVAAVAALACGARRRRVD